MMNDQAYCSKMYLACSQAPVLLMSNKSSMGTRLHVHNKYELCNSHAERTELNAYYVRSHILQFGDGSQLKQNSNFLPRIIYHVVIHYNSAYQVYSDFSQKLWGNGN